MATVQGVYSASVLDNRDPQLLGRVRVVVPAVGLKGVWARVATMMAGAERGTWFIPEVGDEVLVAFEGGDLQIPYVIGALWSVSARPPVASGDAVAVKMIRSRTGATFRIQEEKATTLVIETPGGQRVTLQDSPGAVRVVDQNGNSVVMDAAGVTVTASARVTVHATAVDVSAGQVTVNTGLARFSGTVQCDTLISNSVISASYSPGAGNIW